MNDPILLPLSRQVTALARRDLSAVELTQAYLDRIDRLDVELRAYLCLDPEGALAAARAADDRRLSGTARSIYDGVPFAAKDNLCTADLPTTCASRMLEGFCAHYDATVIRRLREGGAILLGKTNMDEFGMGSTTEHSALFPTRNPLDHTRSPGGSSGGSAAAVAAGMAAFALGSDTGGSVRQPAAFCGTVGMKPTYGRLSRYGLVAFASSLDTVGVITHSVRDNASLLSFLSEPDPKDATSRAFAGDPSLGITGSVRGLRIGLCPLLLEEGIGDDVRAATLRAAEALRAAGAVNVKVDLPSISAALAAYYVISSAEASSNLARYDGVRYGRRASRYSDTDSLYRNSRSEGFGKEVKRRILLGTFVLSEGACEQYYQKALGIRALLAEELRQAFAACDVILCPTAPATAPLLGVSYDSPTDLYAGDLCTVPASLSGLPALSLPWEQDRNGMPIGIQLMGRAGEEALLYRVGSALEAMKGGSDHD